MGISYSAVKPELDTLGKYNLKTHGQFQGSNFIGFENIMLQSAKIVDLGQSSGSEKTHGVKK
jgi:hypothetical protein